jgi:glycosyltransferase 2 family protein
LKKAFINVLKVVLFLGLGLFFIWLFMHNLTREEKKEIYDSFLNANYFWIIVSFVFALLSHISRTLRWMILLEPMGYFPRKKNTFLALMIGYFANLALPRLGEITRCGILLKYEKIPIQKSFGTVVAERALDLIMLGLIFIITLVVNINKLKLFRESALYINISEKYNNIENPNVIFFTVILITGLLIFLFLKFRHKISHFKLYIRIKNIFFGFLEGLKSLVTIKKPFWFIFHTLFIWFMYLSMTWIIFFCLPETSHLNLAVGLAVLAFGSIAIVLVQGGIGIYPWIVAEILILFAIPSTTGYALGWLLWTGQTVMVIATGLISMVALPIINNNHDAKP